MNAESWITQWNLSNQKSGDLFGAKVKAGQKANAYQNRADRSANSAISEAQYGAATAYEGINAVKQASGTINNSILNMGNNAAAASAAAGSMSSSITGVQDQARLVNQQANNLLPYASTLKGYATTLWDQGTNLVGQGNNVLNTGNDILSMNAGASGIAGEYVNWLNSIDPNKYVSAAASDVQSASTNAQGQMMRNLSRSGVSSGRSLSLQQQFAQGLAAALAGAKTRARRQGLADKGTALSGAISAAQGLLTTGSNVVGTGLQSQTAAGSNIASAANIESTAGELYGKAGDLQATAGQLQGAQANAYSNAASIYGQTGELAIGNAKALVDAYGNATAARNALSTAQSKAAEYYASVAQGYGSIAGVRGLFAS